MRYKKITLSITAGLLLGNLVSAQTPQQTVDLAPNSIIAYFAEDGSLLPTREGSSYYRYFKDIVSGCYLVQDFYSLTDQKQIDPICFTDPSELQSWFPQSLQGPLVFWDADGQKTQEGYSQQDGGLSGFWKSWDKFGNSTEYELINGEQIIAYFDPEGNRQAQPVPNGTFRTLLEYEPETEEYIVADYFTDTRARQMDPVVIRADDLMRWDIQYRKGPYTYYNIEGDLTTLENYQKGQLHGIVTNWYENLYPHQKYDEMIFNKGKQEGLYLRWYTNGYPQIKMTIANDDIETLTCWDEEFKPLETSMCFELLNDDPDFSNISPLDQIEDEQAPDIKAVEAVEDAPIEIIIPTEVEDEDEAAEITEAAVVEEVNAVVEDEESETNSATVIFPHSDEEDEEAFDIQIDLEDTTSAQADEAEAESEFVDEPEEIEIEIEEFEETEEAPETEGQQILKSIKNLINAM